MYSYRCSLLLRAFTRKPSVAAQIAPTRRFPSVCSPICSSVSFSILPAPPSLFPHFPIISSAPFSISPAPPSLFPHFPIISSASFSISPAPLLRSVPSFNSVSFFSTRPIRPLSLSDYEIVLIRSVITERFRSCDLKVPIYNGSHVCSVCLLLHMKEEHIFKACNVKFNILFSEIPRFASRDELEAHLVEFHPNIEELKSCFCGNPFIGGGSCCHICTVDGVAFYSCESNDCCFRGMPLYKRQGFESMKSDSKFEKEMFGVALDLLGVMAGYVDVVFQGFVQVLVYFIKKYPHNK